MKNYGDGQADISRRRSGEGGVDELIPEIGRRCL
jgi:hypothetical protein